MRTAGTQAYIGSTTHATPTRLPDQMNELNSTIRSQRGDWRHRIRWFAAEFAVVVSGILVAIALQSWWNARQDRLTEHALLTEMLADLTEDSVRFSVADSTDSAGVAAVAELSAHIDRRAPFADSLARTYGQLAQATTISLQSAQYQTLQSRGLGLIRNDSLRSAITTLYEITSASLNNHNEWLKTAESRWMPLMLRRFRMTPDSLTAYPRNYAKLLDDEEFRLFLDEFAYYMKYTGPWKQDAMQKAGVVMQMIRDELER